jgi:signal transduction histidine kinase
MSANGAESERRRVARDIHDRLGYWLSLAHVELDLLELHSSRDAGRAAAHLAAARQAVAEGLAEIRRMVCELRPSRAMDSLEKELRMVADATAPATTTVDVVVAGEEQRLAEPVRDELFLVLREALRNAFAHAGPATVSVRVDIRRDEVRAHVTDDGKGYDPRLAAPGGGTASMRERMELLGGSISTLAAPGRGCSVRLHLPLPG